MSQVGGRRLPRRGPGIGVPGRRAKAAPAPILKRFRVLGRSQGGEGSRKAAARAAPSTLDLGNLFWPEQVCGSIIIS
jgi:hypothetical protein